MIPAPHAVRVLIATTDGPVEVQSLIDEDPELGRSVACIDGTTRTAGIDRDYQAFVARGTGLIERLYEHGAFRLDVSGRIDAGASWQLAVLIAHALHAAGKLARAKQPAEMVVWATGQISPVDLAVSEVAHLAQKLDKSLDRLRVEAAAGRQVLVIWPRANARDADEQVRLKLQAMGARILEPETADFVLSSLHLREPVRAASPARRRPVHIYEVNLHGGQMAPHTEPPSSRLLSGLLLAPLSVKALVAIAAGAAVAIMILAGIRLTEPKSPILPMAAARPEVAKEIKKVETHPPGPPQSQPPVQSQPFASPTEAGKANLPPVLPAAPSQQAAVPSQPPQPPSEGPSTAVAASFDGVWIATFTGGTLCTLKSGTYQLTINQGAILESRPDTGRVDATGTIEYTLLGAASPIVVVEHRGKLVGDSGRGNYKVRGGNCVGVTEFKRWPSGIVAPAPQSAEPAGSTVNQTQAQRETKGAALQGFDGPWRVISTGGTYCPVKSLTWQLVVENGHIIASRPEPGRVEPDGTFRFTLPARVDPNTIVRYHGKLSGDSGRGNYTGGGGCVGTIELKRLPRQQ